MEICRNSWQVKGDFQQGQTATGPRPVRVRFFKIYRAPRVRPASGPHPLSFHMQGRSKFSWVACWRAHARRARAPGARTRRARATGTRTHQARARTRRARAPDARARKTRARQTHMHGPGRAGGADSNMKRGMSWKGGGVQRVFDVLEGSRYDSRPLPFQRHPGYPGTPNEPGSMAKRHLKFVGNLDTVAKMHAPVHPKKDAGSETAHHECRLASCGATALLGMPA
eukprot:gene11013-biopygen4821